MNDPKYPFGYAADYLKLKTNPNRMSNNDAASVRQAIAEALDMSDDALAEILANKYLMREGADAR